MATDQSAEGRRVRARWREPIGWERYARLLEFVVELQRELPTMEILAAVDLAHDPRGGIGGLHAASALGCCHARSAGRRTLVWRAGSRPAGEVAPKLAREAEYLRVLALLRRNPRAAFPTGLLQDLAGGRTRQEMVGALKTFVAAGLVVHVVMRPQTKNYGVSCWGWASPDVRERDRYYRGGVLPGPELSFEQMAEDGRLDAALARRER